MKNTDKVGCRILVELLELYGVKDAILCPGARGLPLIMAFSRSSKIKCTSIIDERCAAFVAFGKSEITGLPVPVVCTSGTAVLNTSPAVAEAYYKHLPLIIISADRPEEWIGQQDSQTIRQNCVLQNIVKKSFCVQGDIKDDKEKWYATRVINEALIAAVTGQKGPVHINMPVETPLNLEEDVHITPVKKVELAPIFPAVDKYYLKALGRRIQITPKILIVAGTCPPDSGLDKALRKLEGLDNITILTENLSNIHLKNPLGGADSLLSFLGKEKRAEMLPDLLITFGGAIVSQFLKSWLREAGERMEHYHIDESLNVVDTFCHLTTKFPMSPEKFFRELVYAIRIGNPSVDSDYKQKWQEASDSLEILQDAYLETAPWCDLKTMSLILNRLPQKTNIQVSNGLSVRYLLNLKKSYRLHRIDCNRGVSGIDGSTSTAVGAASCYPEMTVLFSGDMSAQYDIAGLLEATKLTRNFKMIIFANGGGNIFKFINTTAGVEENDNVLFNNVNVDFKTIAASNGWYVNEWQGEEKEPITDWLKERQEPSLLILKSDPEVNSSIFKSFLKIKV